MEIYILKDGSDSDEEIQEIGEYIYRQGECPNIGFNSLVFGKLHQLLKHGVLESEIEEKLDEIALKNNVIF